MPVITFYEIDTNCPSSLNQLSDVEGTIFDYINNQGAASQKGTFRIARSHGFSQAETARAISQLVYRGLIARRNVTVEHDEDLK